MGVLVVVLGLVGRVVVVATHASLRLVQPGGVHRISMLLDQCLPRVVLQVLL